jgi:hypothetical protein
MKYDKAMIEDFLVHLAAELTVQQLGFHGRAAGSQLAQGVEQLRARYETRLLPPAERIGILSSSPDGEDDRAGTLEMIVQVRGDQIKHAIALYELMAELEFYEATHPEAITESRQP